MQRDGDSGIDVLVRFFFSMRDTLKLYHWRTTCYARHKATDELLSALEPLIDQFVEIYSGRYRRPSYLSFETRVFQLDDAAALERLKRYAQYLRADLVAHVDPSVDTDLITVRDEMLAALNRAVYLYALS